MNTAGWVFIIVCIIIGILCVWALMKVATKRLEREDREKKELERARRRLRSASTGS
jgi:uncharacterized membrane-anchored protein YhcB (DUF1043 family)